MNSHVAWELLAIPAGCNLKTTSFRFSTHIFQIVGDNRRSIAYWQ